MTEDTPPDAEDTGPEDTVPITPEVVDGGDGAPPRRGASSRKRRLDPTPDVPGSDVPGTEDARPTTPMRPGRGQPTGRIFHMAAMLLVGLGLLELILTVPAVLDPAEARCSAARNAVESANDDDEDFNDVALPEGVEEAGDLDCDDAIALAGRIPDDEDDEPAADAEYSLSESTILVQSSLFAVHGLACGVVGFFLRRKPTRTLRNVALVLVAIAVLPLTQLGIVGLALVAFLVFALYFSADAKALFPVDRTRPSLFRLRPPAGS